MDSEKLIEQRLREGVQNLGGIAIKLISAYLTGLPDRLVLLPGGRIYFVELKSTGKKPTKLQDFMFDKLRKLGFKVLVIDTLCALRIFLNDLKF
jgi:hypothetical protein